MQELENQSEKEDDSSEGKITIVKGNEVKFGNSY